MPPSAPILPAAGTRLPPPRPGTRPSDRPRAPLGRCGNYELLLDLASGGMATVYLARPLEAGERAQFVAIKRPHRHLAKDKAFLSMLVDEARLASAIDHPNVVRVRELGFDTSEPFIVLDYVEGASLADLRRELGAAERAVDTKVAVRIVLDALAGLHAAHELRDASGRHLGIIHRDVSPHNVLIGCDGRVRLTDFGIAKAEDRVQETQTHEVKGKLAYLAPERIDKRRICTVQSDVFSMAVVLWECIAGRRLFRGEEAVDTLQEVLHAPIPKLRQLGANVPPALDDAIARGLSRDLTHRWQTAKQFADAIERAAGRANIGQFSDVARVMETVFGARMRFRHEDMRRVVSDSALVDRLLHQSGIPQRPPPTADMQMSSPMLYAAIAPPAPSERYAFGNLVDSVSFEKQRRAPWGIIAAAGGGAIIGAAALVVMFARVAGHDVHALDERTAAAAAPTSAPLSPGVRRVVVPLPFNASQVRFDDVERQLDPPADVSAFDVRSESGTRHRVVAFAPDGSRGEAYVREEDGVARPEDGFTVTRATDKTSMSSSTSAGAAVPTTATGTATTTATTTGAGPGLASTRPAAPRAQGASPIGTTKNGFTKLK